MRRPSGTGGLPVSDVKPSANTGGGLAHACGNLPALHREVALKAA